RIPTSAGGRGSTPRCSRRPRRPSSLPRRTNPRGRETHSAFETHRWREGPSRLWEGAHHAAKPGGGTAGAVGLPRRRCGGPRPGGGGVGAPPRARPGGRGPAPAEGPPQRGGAEFLFLVLRAVRGARGRGALGDVPAVAAGSGSVGRGGLGPGGLPPLLRPRL